MKKEEAKKIAPRVSNYVMEALEQFLTYSEKVTGTMYFDCAKINNQKFCTININISELNIDDHINTGITVDHCDVLYEHIFNDLLDKFLDSDIIGVGRYREIKPFMGESFTGMNYTSLNGSGIRLNFLLHGNSFNEIVSGYINRIKEYEEKMKNDNTKQAKQK